MHFLVDHIRKIIFGWSAKCGCSHVKNIFWFLQTDQLNNEIHTTKDYFPLPHDIENYTTLIFCRNPYKRIVSGFLDKYKNNGEHRHLWNHSLISFSNFVNELIQHDWKIIDHHHFTPQTTEEFDKRILLSKTIKLYDISNIDYDYIETLYNKKIPEYIITKKQGHERVHSIKNNESIKKYVYNLNIDDYIDYPVDIKYFYNEELKKKVFLFYLNDFKFFYENNINYVEDPL